MRTTPAPSSTTAPIPTTRDAPDALTLLARDHSNVQSLFAQFEGLSQRARASRKSLAVQICTELTRHMTAEEEIFYPAVRDANSDNEDLLDEAIVEHAAAKDMIAQILAADAADELFDAMVKVLSEQIDHHIDEEEHSIFPKARKAKLDLRALGQAIQDRKDEIEGPAIN